MKKILLFLAIGLLLSFFLFSRFVRNGGMRSADFAFTVKVQEKIDKTTHLRAAALVDNLMDGSTFLASPSVSVMLVIFLTIIGIYDFKNKKIRYGWLAIPVLFGLLTLAEMYGKTVVHHPSPPFAFIKHSVSVFPKDYINEQFSYPSGHAARAVFLSGTIFLLAIQQFNNLTIRKRIGIFIFLFSLFYILLVSISRIYLGHHWLSDVIGGGLLGSACILFIPGIL